MVAKRHNVARAGCAAGRQCAPDTAAGQLLCLQLLRSGGCLARDRRQGRAGQGRTRSWSRSRSSCKAPGIKGPGFSASPSQTHHCQGSEVCLDAQGQRGVLLKVGRRHQHCSTACTRTGHYSRHGSLTARSMDTPGKLPRGAACGPAGAVLPATPAGHGTVGSCMAARAWPTGPRLSAMLCGSFQ